MVVPAEAVALTVPTSIQAGACRVLFSEMHGRSEDVNTQVNKDDYKTTNE